MVTFGARGGTIGGYVTGFCHREMIRMSDSTHSLDHVDSVDLFAQRILDITLGAMDAVAVYLGDRLGWYRSLADEGPATPGELAERTGTHERYAREWLEQQAVTGILTVADGRFSLSAAGTTVLTDTDDRSYSAPLARMVCGAMVQLPALLHAYRTGGGVEWARLGRDARESQADVNRPWFESALPDALKSVPEVDSVLREPGVKILDIGCGGGWSTIALARTYPAARLIGIDLDAATVDMARRNVASNPDVSQRIGISLSDASELSEAGYDAAFAFECIHDMSQPIEVLSAVRRALSPGAPLIVMDEAVAETFTAPGDDAERLMYGYSLMICLPDGMSRQPSAATGTVMRPSTLRSYAQQAGFTKMDVLPIEDFGFFRFYRLRAG